MTRPGTGPDYALEAASPAPVCGVDEAGRGPWAGPVSAAAVILAPDRIPVGLDDSKALTERRREALEAEVKAAALAWGVGFASVEEIDAMNILKATGLAMRRAVEALSPAPAFILVDGSYRFDLPAPVRPVVKGDSLSVSIAAASILAKTARDRVMLELDRDWPDYGFAAHKGYHSSVHVEALRRFGPCPAHRRSFAPIRALLEAAD
ncbi:ribonuclease HII [Phenylobacterium sp.]|uniref:ribonuclease HII n=1 Tax=Phenylobacterium sp. TaxID=1871053 RepID=UPI0025CBAB57|nr:ribonuclease HII [Phenylobacterium sp.]MCA6288498.1 ribonuclease HII [Phenylobacterium sp.]MCA6342929.1 ribonuclease HII [Phenylobacterium sp.]